GRGRPPDAPSGGRNHLALLRWRRLRRPGAARARARARGRAGRPHQPRPCPRRVRRRARRWRGAGMTTRFGVDVGGTFTDCVLYAEASGTVYVDKAPTVPAAPEAGVLAVVRDGVPAATLAQAEL